MSSLRSGARPMSAHTPSQARNLIAKTFNEKSNPNSVDNVAKIWTAFGKYVSKTLKAGKGVGIPKFGQFTFTPMQVDLAGSTNPDKRDKQIREPIFQIAKDFVLGLPLQSGVVHDNGVIRPFEIKGSSGIVPKVRINYTEIGYIAGVSKEEAKHGCDIVIRDLSDKVKSGQQAKLLIPCVGSFICRTKIAGVKFDKNVVEESKGKTSKAHFVNKLFSNSVNRANLDILDQKVSQGIRTRAANFETNKRIPIVGRHDNTISVTPDAQNWLKTNFGVDLDIDTPHLHKTSASNHKMKRTFSARPGFRSNNSERGSSVRSGQILNRFEEEKLEGDQGAEPLFKIRNTSQKKRPMSAYSGASRRSVGSSKSAASIVLKMTRANALMYCNKIASNKAILDQVQSSKFNARDQLTPSEIQHVLQGARVFMDIATLRGFLSHLNFSAHGKACSILDLIRRSKEWAAKTELAKQPGSMAQKPSSLFSIGELIAKIRDCFYKTGNTIKEIHDIGCDKNREIDSEAFVFLCKKYCYPSITEEDSRRVYEACYSKIGANLSLNDFQSIFGADIPKNNYHIQGLRLIRDWMYKNGLTSEQAFDQLANNRDRMNVEQFETALKRIFNMTSPEIDSVFVSIDLNNDKIIDREEWLEKVYEDSANPLQLLREIVNEHDLNADDLLFKMNLRIWDDALDFNKFAKALRLLDSSLTDVQLRAMAKSLKNSKNYIEVPTLIKNLVGQDYETVDFRDKLFKKLYNEILDISNSGRKDKLKGLLVKYDNLNDGTIVAQDLIKVLSQVCKNIKDGDIEKFVRFLEKDNRGRIDYTQFISNLEQVRDHNPFKSLVSRIKSFMSQNNQNSEAFMKRLVTGESQASSHYKEEEGLDKERKVSVDFFAKFLKNKVDKKRDLAELQRYAQLMDIDSDGYVSIHDLQS